MRMGFIPTMVRGRTTDPEYVGALAGLLEECEVESVWTVEHVVVAENYEPLYPYSEDGRMPTGPDTAMPDPLEWLSFMAALTQRVRLGTSVVIASQHSAAILAKRAATLDALSRGRLSLGVGLGWQREEYEAVGVPYRDRGRRLDECIEAMRALWQDGPATYQGKYQRFENVRCDTQPVQEGGIPILIGGSSDHAARRAGRLGNGFYPYVISPEDFATRLITLREAARDAGRDADAVELTIWPGSYDFTRTFDLDLVRAYVDQGVSRLVISAGEGGGDDLDSMRRLLESYHEQVIEKL
ncbi:MAG: LLM class F420-dependent oxidoreductase [Myxococcales bacterium]|nr:LLM class F420-dependent oxidoreductase [Myxococcales bacterium]